MPSTQNEITWNDDAETAVRRRRAALCAGLICAAALGVPLSAGLCTDFAAYVTIMNRTNSLFQLVSYQGDQSIFNPSPPPSSIPAQNGQIFFALSSTRLFSGVGGTVTYEAVDLSGLRSIGFTIDCPLVTDNLVAVPLNQTGYYVDYYATNAVIDWNPDGSNWGPVKNYPVRGHPISALFVIKQLR